jgi:hypothetical protein
LVNQTFYAVALHCADNLLGTLRSDTRATAATGAEGNDHRLVGGNVVVSM